MSVEPAERPRRVEREVAVQGRVWLAVASLFALGACDVDAATSTAEPTPFVLPVEPAADAGGVCRMLDYEVVRQTVGTRFTVAVASTHQSTQTCVLQAGADSRPDLVLSVTPTTADAAVFADAMAPAGAQELSGLGKAAYRITVKPQPDHGAGVELGWLSVDRRLISLRFTFATGHGGPAAAALTPKLVALAKRVEAQPR